MTDQTTGTTTLQDKADNLIVALNSVLVERTAEIQCAVAAVFGKLHHFTIGPPGIAKSMLPRELVKRIDGLDSNDYFEWLMTRYTTPDELFGPMSLSALERDEFKRNPNHKLPLAKIAFLDEIFKANSANLNTLLKIVNEREWDNNGAPIHVPLGTLFSASNELPEGEELAALWDRIHFRQVVEPIKDGGNFTRMLAVAAARHASEDDENPESIITWAEVQEAQAQVRAVEIPNDIFEAMLSLREALREEGITPSDRRSVEAMKIIKVTAWLNRRTVADIDDMRLLRHAMWTDPSHIKTVTRLVLDLANPIDKEASEVLEDLEGLSNDLDKAIKDHNTQKDLARNAVEIHGKLQLVKDRMEDLKVRAEAAGRKSEVLDQLKERFISVAKRLMKDGFGINEDESA